MPFTLTVNMKCFEIYYNIFCIYADARINRKHEMFWNILRALAI